MGRRHARFLALAAMLLLAMAAPGQAIAVAPGTSSFERTWARTDQPVASGAVQRTWMWGQAAFSAPMTEWYAESPGGQRVVQYFDKSRMEITHPEGDQNSIWYVTNGLIVKELITGQMQMGDNTFVAMPAAQVNVAGDPDDANGPTYASFAGQLTSGLPTTQSPITRVIHRGGSVTSDAKYAQYAIATTQFAAETGHWIAAPFWDFMNATGTVQENGQLTTAPLFQSPYYATGLPITDPFWAPVKVAGTVKDVLLQCFERRCLTFTPSNPAEWQLEMGNVGQHYFKARYGMDIPGEPPAADANHSTPTDITPLTEWPVDNGGQARLLVANQSPYTLQITLDGPTSKVLTIAACPTCIVYPPNQPPASCMANLPTQEVLLPAGNYRVQMDWLGSPNTDRVGGPWTLVPDSSIATCYYLIQRP
jgi:hypothetical protein